MFGCVKLAALIQVVLVLSVVFVCSGLFFTIFSYLNLKYMNIKKYNIYIYIYIYCDRSST